MEEALKRLKPNFDMQIIERLESAAADPSIDRDIHTRLGDTEKGIQFFEEVLQDSESRGYIPTQIEAHYQLCATHWLRGNLKEALKNAKNGLSLTIEGEQTLPRAKILLSMSSLQAHLGQITTSCAQMEEVISVLKVLKQKTALYRTQQSRRGSTLRGMWQESTQNAQESLQLSQENLYQIGKDKPNLFSPNLLLNEGYTVKPLATPKRCIALR